VINCIANRLLVFDYVHVSEIHNTTIPSGDLLTPEVLFQLQTLADNHEFNLAYNATEPIRAIAGSTLAAQIGKFSNMAFDIALAHESSPTT
jgi:hypothetical protein